MSLYTGQSLETGKGLAQRVVLDLANKYLDQGRTLITDNFYTSITLAEDLLQKQTHLLGTIRKNKKGIPKAVVDAKLSRGEIIGRESTNGIVIAKWRDKRDVMFLTTKHGIDIKATGKHDRTGVEKKKPEAILEYNKGKMGLMCQIKWPATFHLCEKPFGGITKLYLNCY